MQREVVILSSSPIPYNHSISTVPVPASQDGPPIGPLLSAPRLGNLKSGSHAHPLPESAVLGFQSALVLLPDNIGEENACVEEPVVEKKKRNVTKTASKPRAKAKSKETDQVTKDANSEPPKKRGRPKKDPNEPPKPRKSRAKRATGAVTTFFDGKENEKEVVDLTFELAAKRRKDWTPPPPEVGTSLTTANESFAAMASKLSEFVHVNDLTTVSNIPETALLKRKRLELIDGAPKLSKKDSKVAKSPTKVSPTKKLKTITALALDKYSTKVTTTEPETAVATPVTNKSKSRAQKKPITTLLSPISAVQRVEKQPVTFGTASQLAGIESPTYLRQLQRAIMESAVEARANELTTGPVRSLAKKFRLAKTTSASQGNMWNAGALNSDDFVVEMSKLDEFQDIDAFPSSPIPIPEDISIAIQSSLPVINTAETLVETVPLIIASPTKKPRGRPRKDASTTTTKPRTTKAKEKTKATTGVQSGPAYVPSDEFIDIDEISDSDPEPNLTPSPPRIIALAPTLPLARSMSPTKTARVPKVSKASKSTKAKRNGTRADWATVQTALFPQITAIVLTTPRSDVPGQPSWFEKMVMFEPIVLEDFTEWLMGRGVVIENEDGKKDELLPWMVQKWCETKSVCCMRRLNNMRVTRPVR
jgi:hypothetical protein